MSKHRRLLARCSYSLAATVAATLISAPLHAGQKDDHSQWTTAVTIPELNSPQADGCPIESEDGLSIFIASPVLTAWKEREPGFIRRRLRIAEVEGYVPAYADDVATTALARDDESEPETAVEADREEAAAAAEPEPVGGAVATAELPEESGNGAGPAGEGDGAGDDPESEPSASAERRKRNEERRARRAQRRKHGRKR